MLARHGRDPAALDTVVVVADFGAAGERALIKGQAASFALRALGGAWAALGASALACPGPWSTRSTTRSRSGGRRWSGPTRAAG